MLRPEDSRSPGRRFIYRQPGIAALAANLVGNAIRHSVRGGQAEIQIHAAGGHRLTIAYTGPVIPADQVTRLMGSFRWLPAASSRWWVITTIVARSPLSCWSS